GSPRAGAHRRNRAVHGHRARRDPRKRRRRVRPPPGALLLRRDEDRADVVEWGALGFLFAVGVLSFADARPRGYSDAEFDPNDEFRLADFVAALKFRNGELHLDTDYIRGRRMKTRAIIRSEGTGMIETRGRGKAALNWICRL